MHLKMSSAKWRLFGLGLNELNIADIGEKIPEITEFSLLFFIFFYYFILP